MSELIAIPDPATAPTGTVLYEAAVPENLSGAIGMEAMRRVRVLATDRAQGRVMVIGMDGWHGHRDLTDQECADWGGIANAGERECVRLLIDALRAEQAARAAAEARVAELETPDMVWRRPYGEWHSSSARELLLVEEDGAVVGEEVRLQRARRLPDWIVRVVADPDTVDVENDDPGRPGDVEVIAVEGTPEFDEWVAAPEEEV